MAKREHHGRHRRFTIAVATLAVGLGIALPSSAPAIWTYDYVSGFGWVTYDVANPFHDFLLSYCTAQPGMCF